MHAQQLACIGFGEAAMAFADGWAAAGIEVRAYDRKTDDAATRDAKRADYARFGIAGSADPAGALAGAATVLSLVTADQALAAAQAAAPAIARGALWFDMNSVAPQTKRAAAEAVERVGGRYVDVAVMAPVHPARRAAPLLLAGPHAAAAAEALAALGFTRLSRVAGPVGAAAAVKMIRSVMVKGMEALTAECVLAAEAAGVTEAVLASLSADGTDWTARADYNLDRMLVHGLRRAAEMEESVKTLEALGCTAAMTRGTVAWQRAVGARQLAPPDGLAAKLEALTECRRSDAA